MTVKSGKPSANDRTLLGVPPGPSRDVGGRVTGSATGGALPQPDAPKSGAKPGANDRTLLGFVKAPSEAVPASVTSVAALVPGAIVANNYVLGEPIQEGGMATIWAATDRATGRAVIVKTIHLHLSDNEEVVKRFQQEADIIAAIKSPHVVELLDRGVLAGSPFLVLERLEGEDLEERLAGRRLSVDECIKLLDQVALALMPAHAAGVVHRDLKPANIYLARGGGGEVVKLLDFGIAKLRESTLVLTAAGQTVGTPEYMSPEQIQGKSDLDGRSDLFAIAAVLYTCLTGGPPFAGGSIAEVFERITDGDLIPPSFAASDVPKRVDPFFARALACDRDARYPDAAAMAEAFRAAAADDAPDVEIRAESAAPPEPAVPALSPAPALSAAPALAAAPQPLPAPRAAAPAAANTPLTPIAKANEAPQSGAMSRSAWLLIAAVVVCVAGVAVALSVGSSDEAAPADTAGRGRSRTEQIPVPQQPAAPPPTSGPRPRGR